MTRQGRRSKDADHGVADHDFQASGCHAGCDMDASALRRELRGFAQQVDQHLFEAAVGLEQSR